MKLLVADYDGTFFINEDDLQKNIIAINKWQEQGNMFMISTGRSYSSIKNQVIINHIPYDYLSCADGSIIYDKEDNILKMYEMDNKIIEPYKNFYQDLNYEEIQFSYPRGYSNILLNDKELLGINVCIATSNYNKKIVSDFIKLSKQYKEYHFLNYMHPNFSYLCIKPRGIDKSSTIDYLKEKLGLKPKDIYVIGDSDNDVEMIKKYNGVCMNTSCSKVLKICNKTYLSVSDYIEDSLN